MTPADLYRNCRLSAWRIETLQHYTVPGDEERQRAFHAGEPLPPPGQGKLDDLALITKLGNAGRTVGRVHVVDWPLSPYIRYEFAAYAENIAAGEGVYIADRSAHPGLEALRQDFAIFDAGTRWATAVTFDYDDSGLIRGYKIIGDRETVESYRKQTGLALDLAVTLADFAAAAATR